MHRFPTKVLLVLLPLACAGPAPAEEDLTARIDQALPKLEAIVRDGMARTGVPGLSLAIVYGDKTAAVKGFGVREVGKDAPVDPDTIFQLASMSKPIASTVIATLVGDGIVKWDDPIVTRDPGFELMDPWVTRAVTLRDMFSHRSGLPDHAGDHLEDIGYDRDQVLYRLRFVDLEGAFRASYAYTNFGLTEAGIAAARAAGKSWEELSEERLYSPAGMTRTSSRYSDYIGAENHAVNAIRVGGKWMNGPPRDPDAESPAGGVSSTARDLAQWLKLQLNDGKLDGRQIVAAEALAETHQPVISRGSALTGPVGTFPPFYGLGWNIDVEPNGRVILSHSGAFNLGVGTNVRLDPAARLGIAVLTNGYPIGFAEAIAKSFFELADQGEVSRDWIDAYAGRFAKALAPDYGDKVDLSPRASATPALPPASYAGIYDSELYGPVEVVAGADGLVLKLGPQKQQVFPLRHVDRDTFAYQPAGENAYGEAAVTFDMAADQAVSVTIENLDITGQGTFARELPEK